MNSDKGKVLSVNISDQKGTIKKPIAKIKINADGIAGDSHSGKWHRQISLLGREDIEFFEKQIGRKILPGEFAENITTENLDIASAKLMDRFKIGTVELEVTQIGKECHGDSCAIFREIGKCVMPKKGIFTRVITGGDIKSNDVITLEKRPLRFSIVTLSDRASRGEYTDRSGPEIKRILTKFFEDTGQICQFDSILLGDDSGKLREKLTQDCNDSVDIIFTTGGTGIGPKDITVDVVLSMSDKIVPGIMEYIRTKYGGQKPNALLSRSVVAVVGKTIIYTLPGSVKAVQEYTPEILKTMLHLFHTLHELDTH